MISVIKQNVHGSKGLHEVKLIMEDNKVKDIECDCIYGEFNKDAWKNPDKKPCKHARLALAMIEMKRKSGRWKKETQTQ